MSQHNAEYIATRTFLFCRGDERVEVFEGQPCPAISDGRLAPMLRLGWVVPTAEYEADPHSEPDTPEPTDEPETAEPSEPKAGDWKQTPVDQLGLSDEITQRLLAAELVVVADVLAYGAANKSLTKLKGIGEASEKAIQQAIGKLVNP